MTQPYGFSGYQKIMKEHFDITDRETREVLLSVNESDQNQILTALVSKLYDNIVEKVDDIDFGDIPKSKGDITKVPNYDKIVECADVIHKLLEQYKQDTKVINVVEDAIGNIRSRKDLFEKGFRYESEFVMLTYSTIVLSVISSVSFMIATCIEFIKSPNQDNFQLALDTVAVNRTKQNLLFTNLQKFNSACNSGDVDKSLDFILKNNMKGFTGIEVGYIVGGIALAGIVLNIIPILRELIFFFYYSRTRISDYFDIQADLLQINAYNLQNNSDTLIKKSEKDRIVKKQLNIVTLFRNIADKVSIDNKKSEMSSVKELSKPTDKVKTTEILDSRPDSATTSSLF